MGGGRAGIVKTLDAERTLESRGAVPVAGSAVAGAGSAATSAVVAACCVPVVSPLLVGVVGASGAAWLAGLRPWAPYLLGGGLLLLLFAYRRLRHVRSCRAGGDGVPEAAPRARRYTATRLLLAAATLVWLGSAVAYLLLTV